MRIRILVGTLFTLTLAGLVWSQPGDRPKVFLGLGGEPAENGGIMVRDVTPDGPAAKAGIKAGDVITKAGDKPIRGFDSVGEALAGKKPGDKLSLTALREGKEQTFEVTLAAPQADRPATPPRTGGGPPAGAGGPPAPGSGFLGVLLQELTPDLKTKLGVAADKGALIADVVPNSPAAKAEIKEGDVIVALDGNPVESVPSLREAIQKAGAGKKLSFKVARGDKMMDVTAELVAATPDRFTPRQPRTIAPDRPRIVDDAARVRELEQRIKELEKKIAELEKKGAKEE